MDIHTFLEELRNETIFYKPNPGNGGDAIIAHATYKLFKEKGIDYRIIQEDTELEGKVLVYSGGGNLVPLYDDCANFIGKYHAIAKKLIVLPHTVMGHEDLLKVLGKNVSIICREQKSFDHLAQFTNFNTFLSQDLALHLRIGADLQINRNTGRLSTIVQRRVLLSSFLKKPSLFRRLLKSHKGRYVLHAFREDSERTVQVPRDNVDVTQLINHDFTMMDEKKVERTCNAIFSFLNQFKEIHTNRLHVCIAAALLGKAVHFYGNSYWKNESVYTYSLRDAYPNVKWMGYEIQ